MKGWWKNFRFFRTIRRQAVALWVKEAAFQGYGPDGQYGLWNNAKNRASIQSIKSIYPEISANAILVLIGVACALLDRQITQLGKGFEEQGVLLNAFTGCARPIKEKEYDHDGLRVNYDHKSHP